MSTARIHLDDASLKKPLVWSMAFHSLLFGSLAVSTLMSHRGETWGSAGGGGAISVKLVGGTAGVPLPRPDAVTTSRVVDPTKGLFKSEPEAPPEPIEAEPI